jgi:hypothetical protein
MGIYFIILTLSEEKKENKDEFGREREKNKVKLS